MLPARPRLIMSAGQVQSYVTPTFIDANFQAVMANDRPPTYPSPADFTAPGTGGFWWVFVDEMHGNSPYIAWTNGASVIVKARGIVSRGVDPSAPSYDGRAAGPMGNESVPVIDDAFLRNLWAWLRMRQREGVGVITQIELDMVSRAARTRTLSLGLARVIVIAAFHSGGVNKSARFLLTSPRQLVVYTANRMPEYDRPLGVFDMPIAQKAFLNNLGNMPPSGLSFIDSLRPASAPRTTSTSPPAPPASAPTTTPASVESPQTVVPPPQFKPTSPTTVTIGSPIFSQPPGQTASELSVSPQPAAPPAQPAGPTAQQGQAEPGVGSLAGSITEVAKKAWPYAAGAAVVLAVAGGGYYLYTRSREE